MFKKNFKDFFIPHADNNYAPHSLQKAAMVAMLFMVVLSFAATNALSLIWVSSQWMVGAVLPAVIVELTNDERGEDALGVLKRSSVLDAAAKLKAQDMAKNEYFAHYSPNGVSPWFWFNQVQYNFVHAGENLAIHFTDSSDVVTAWMESPTHRANIMNGNYTEIGVGTAEGTYEGFKTIYVVQLFGTPAAPIVATAAVPSVAGETIGVDETSKTSVVEEEQVLSESASITETVEVVKVVDEVSTTEEKEVIVQDEVGTTTLATAESEVPEPKEEVVVASQEPVVPTSKTSLYSDFMSTSTGGIAAMTSPTDGQNAQSTPLILKIATQPHVILQTMYLVIGFFVLMCLLLSILIEIKYQQPVQIAYGVGLLTLMSALFYIHTSLITGAFIL